jgi:hypothetical protein
MPVQLFQILQSRALFVPYKKKKKIAIVSKFGGGGLTMAFFG